MLDCYNSLEIDKFARPLTIKMKKIKVLDLVPGKFYFFINEYKTYNPIGIVKHRCSDYF
jgi:hypothetical protein